MFKIAAPFTCPMELLIPTLTNDSGIVTKTYPKTGVQIFGNFRAFLGTDVVTSGVYSVEATAHIETWYRPDITPICRLKINGQNYEILGEPENINMRNQYLKFKVRLIKGGA